MKRGLCFVFVFAATSVFVTASARDAAADPACAPEAVSGQELRNRGKLIASRAKLLACTQPSCAPEIVRDCTRWLDEVTADLPTVVFGAKNDAGADVTDAAVFVDESPAGNTSAGRPVPLDPGTHKIRFEKSGFAPVVETIVARGGEKNRSVVASFVPVRPPPPAPSPAPAPSPSPVEPSRPVPVATWILGGTGVVALGVFGFFGATGVGDRHRLGCDIGCDASDKSSVDKKFVIADVAFGVAVVAIAAAVVMYFITPTER